MSDMKLSVLISAIDKFSAPAQKVAQVSDVMAEKLQGGQKSLQALGKQQQTITRLNQLQKGLGTTAAEMDKARKTTARLGRELASTEKPTKRLQQQFDSARRKSDALKRTHQEQKNKLQQLRTELRGAGVDTRKLGEAQRKITAEMNKASQAMERMAQKQAKVDAARQQYDRSLNRAGNVALVAGGLNRVGQTAMGMLTSPMQEMRQVERSRGELASLGMNDIDAVMMRGREMSKQLSGINTAAFISAAYDIKSGISTLSDKGVADMTALAALTAKATKSNTGQMTSLFATAYGSFKNSLFEGASDEQFGAAFSALLAKSVQQFKTDGAKMQQAIQGMGSGLAESGISLSDQLTALGMLQQKMEAGVAGTTMAALERSAAQAQERFAQMGMDIQVLNEDGNLRNLDDLLEEMQTAYGDSYTSETGAQIQKAFGSDEAVKFFKALWGQQEAFRANSQSLQEARQQGEAFTRTMAKAMDNNMDARLQMLSQRWSIIKEKIGYALIPVLEKLTPMLEKGAEWISRFVDGNSGLSTTLITVVGGIGALALVAAPVITAIASLSAAVAALGYWSKKARLDMAMGAAEGMGGGSKRGKGGRLGKVGKMMGGKLGMASAAIGLLSVGSTLADDGLSTGEKAADVTNTAGVLGGAWGGAKLGAALGTAIAPGIGTAIGGLLGSIAGGIGGGWLGDKLGSLFTSDKKEEPEETPKPKTGPALAVTAALATTPAIAANTQTITHEDNSQYQISVQQLPGEDPEAVAMKVMEKIREYKAGSTGGEMFDE